jgi:CHAT domain
VLIAGADTSFPWEIMTPHRDGDAAEPLGVAHAVARWPIGSTMPPAARFDFQNGYVIAPRYQQPLPGLDSEATYLVSRLGAERISPATVETINRALAQRAAPLVHFAGHLTKSELGTTMMLDEDQQLTASRLRVLAGAAEAFRAARPFVFVNACPMGKDPGLARDDLATELLRLGAAGVMLLMWEVSDEAATRFAIEFYERAQRFPEVPCAEIVRRIRSEASVGRGDDLSSMAYAYFGNPFATARAQSG